LRTPRFTNVGEGAVVDDRDYAEVFRQIMAELTQKAARPTEIDAIL
jgi:hypothetical protein